MRTHKPPSPSRASAAREGLLHALFMEKVISTLAEQSDLGRRACVHDAKLHEQIIHVVTGIRVQQLLTKPTAERGLVRLAFHVEPDFADDHQLAGSDGHPLRGLGGWGVEQFGCGIGLDDGECLLAECLHFLVLVLLLFLFHF